jgi:heterotetrameric sarcosine oxidase delta subunit
MLLLSCPNCGARNVTEFRFGGEQHLRPQDPQAASDAEWNDFVYLRVNLRGVQREWWYHRAGCGLWFLAERNTGTNEVLRTFIWEPPGQRTHDDVSKTDEPADQV